jgi:hypothetical protein
MLPNFLIISTIFISVIELIIPFFALFSFIKFSFLLVLINFYISNKYKLLLICNVAFFSFFYLCLVLFSKYSISNHFLLLIILNLLIIGYLFKKSSKDLKLFINFFYIFIILISFYKMAVALNIIFNLNINFLSIVFWEISGGGIYSIGGFNIPRITFGPESLFLISYILFHQYKYSYIILIALLLGFSRVYLVMLLFVILYLKKYHLFIIFTLLFLISLLSGNIFDERPLLEFDPRFIQWKIFFSMFENILFLGDFNYYINKVQYNLSLEEHDYVRSECEACQITSDFGIIPFIFIYFSQFFILKAYGLCSEGLNKFLVYSLILIVASFFNPLLVSMEFVALHIIIFAKLIYNNNIIDTHI